MEKCLIGRSLAIGLVLTFSMIVSVASADNPGIPCYHYGTETDGYLWKETAFATWWFPPPIPLTVRPDFMGIALAGYLPGTLVEIGIVDLPFWAWEELREDLIGRTVIAVVADRPGLPTYADAWSMTFWALSGGRMWVGLLYVEITELQ